MPDGDNPAPQPIRLGILLIDSFALLSYASFIEPFRAANNLAGERLYDWTHLSLSGGAAIASNGVRLVTDGDAGLPPDFDMLFLFAAGDPAAFHDERCFAWLRTLARHDIPIGGISGGPFLMARAGLLAGRRATIHWEHAEALEAAFPDIALERGLFVIDGKRMTCAGGTAGLDMAIFLIERDQGSALAHSVSEWFIRTDPRRPDIAQRAGLAQRYGVTDSRLLLMLGAMEAATEDPLPRAALARTAGLSLRQLDRLCRERIGTSVAETYLAIRLERARELLRSTDLSIMEVAVACGFRSAAHFSRRFHQRYARRPSNAAAGAVEI